MARNAALQERILALITGPSNLYQNNRNKINEFKGCISCFPFCSITEYLFNLRLLFFALETRHPTPVKFFPHSMPEVLTFEALIPINQYAILIPGLKNTSTPISMKVEFA